MVTDSWRDRIELKYISHESSQSSQSGGRNTCTRKAHQNHCRGSGVGFRDELVASDDSWSKTQRQSEVNHPRCKLI